MSPQKAKGPAPKKAAPSSKQPAKKSADTAQRASKTPIEAPESAPAKAPAKASRAATASPEALADPAAKVARPALDRRTLAALRRHLETERANLQSQADALEAERRQLAADRDSTDDSFTEESGEGATTTMEQEKDISIAANVADLLEKVDRALARMDAGTYGLCERCGKPIGKPRLEALPWAALCIACKQKEEHRFV